MSESSSRQLTTPPQEQTRPYRVLVVCYANQCRSPIAEIVLRAMLKALFARDSVSTWSVASAGTYVTGESGMHPLAYEALTERGYFGRGDAARQITPEMIEASDLILTSDRDQRATVVRLCPSAVRRTYTLRQFARLSAAGREAEPDITVRSGEDLEKLAAIGRPRLQWVEPEADEIPDPIGRDIEAFRETLVMIRGCFDQMFGGG